MVDTAHLRDSFARIRRFDTSRLRLPLSPNVLTTLLDALVAHGLCSSAIQRTPAAEVPLPPRAGLGPAPRAARVGRRMGRRDAKASIVSSTTTSAPPTSLQPCCDKVGSRDYGSSGPVLMKHRSAAAGEGSGSGRSPVQVRDVTSRSERFSQRRSEHPAARVAA